MKQIKTFQELLEVMKLAKEKDYNIYCEIDHVKYEFDIIKILQTPFGDLITRLTDGLLFYKKKEAFELSNKKC